MGSGAEIEMDDTHEGAETEVAVQGVAGGLRG